jgi:hypothetical protein
MSEGAGRVEAPAVREAAGVPCEPRHLLRVSRGFSCLFWGMPVLAAGHAIGLTGTLPVRWTLGVLLAAFLPMLCGLWRLRIGGALTARWDRRVGQSLLVALAAMYLSPFLAWWNAAPMQGYFAANAAAHYGMLVVLLAGLNRLAGEAARWMGDAGLRREARAGLGMVLWLSLCTVAALAWLFHRAGVLDAGWLSVLGQLNQLPGEARTLFLLPYAMTAYVMWRTKETGFRRAAGGAIGREDAPGSASAGPGHRDRPA